MLKIYGTIACKDCEECIAAFEKAGLTFEFLEFRDDLSHLKEFLKLRDSSSLFDPVREAGGIGIPCIIREDGSMTLDWPSCLTV